MENIPFWQHFLFAAVATCGFAIFFNVQKKLLLVDSIVGGLGWIIYLYGYYNIDNPTLYSFIAAAFVSIVSEIMARKLKQPAIMIVIPGILPLIPGLRLYDAIYLVMQKNYVEAANSATRAFMVSIGIALGVLVISSLSRVFNLYKLRKAFVKNDSLKYQNWVNFGKNRTNSIFVLNRNEMNDQLNSLNIDTSLRERDAIEKFERSSTEDFAVDNVDQIDSDIDEKYVFVPQSEEELDTEEKIKDETSDEIEEILNNEIETKSDSSKEIKSDDSVLDNSKKEDGE
ncbi:threonine/serine exporter family protein [Peptostreptococcus faecalis]|uniref:threonine/serine exporter family protein n=1 Tax=Peptostreptococcus faecalis TaxID=2045015 RepID=UPI000C7E2F6E|nr:threonine/serine exporter family protein [Peptostreptococcus faecalis]